MTRSYLNLVIFQPDGSSGIQLVIIVRGPEVNTNFMKYVSINPAKQFI